MPSTQRQSVHVTIVASSVETLDGLEAYLSFAGLGVHRARRLGDFGREPCAAVVVFPDEFAAGEVLHELGRLRREQPTVLPLLVTQDPLRYSDSAVADGAGLAPIIIPKPAWGSTIVDAIRLAVEAQRGDAL